MIEIVGEALDLSEKMTSKLRSECQEGAHGMKFQGKNISSRGSSGGRKALESRKMVECKSEGD